MKVLIYTHEFPPFRGGAGVYSEDLAVGLRLLGLEVHVATPLPNDTLNTMPESARSDGLTMHYMAEWQTWPTAAHLVLDCLQLRHWFDMIVVTERRAQEIVATMTKRPFRYVAVIHGTELLNYFGGERSSLAIDPLQMAQFYESAEMCIAVSHATSRLARTLLNIDRLKLATVQNGINPARLRPARPQDSATLRQRYGADAEIVFCLGRLDLDKGQDALIEAFREVRRQCPRARLLIGGDGPNMAGLMRLRTALGLDDCVDFLGAIPATVLPAYFDVCAVFALTSRSESRWEGFGLVYLEAGFYGKPSVGGNQGGVPEAIANNESGFVVAPRDHGAIASAIVALLADVDLRTRMGERGRERVRSYFNAFRMAQETLGHIEQALKVRPPQLWRGQRAFLVCHIVREGVRVAASQVLRAIRSRFQQTPTH